MYKINPPKIHLSTVLGYDVEGKRYIVKDEKIFDTERELVCFLARYNRPVCNKEKQGRSQHKCYPWRDDARYIQRARAAYAMEAEEEYRRFVKAKDKSFKSIWPDEEFNGYHSTGWKDNSGNRYRHQWEAKERRNYEKIKRNKDITMFSGKKRESPKRRKTKEELLEELDMLRKEFEC